MFEANTHLLGGVGRDGTPEHTEDFICRLYGAPDPIGGVDQARDDMFERGHKEQERLSPIKCIRVRFGSFKCPGEGVATGRCSSANSRRTIRYRGSAEDRNPNPGSGLVKTSCHSRCLR